MIPQFSYPLYRYTTLTDIRINPLSCWDKKYNNKPDICTHQLISRLSTNQLVAEASISYVEHVFQTLPFSHHVIHKKRHLETFCPVSLIKKEGYDNLAHTTPYSTESQKLQISTKHNAMNREPMNRTWGKNLRNRPDGAPLRPNQGQVYKKIAKGEDGVSGACRSIFSGGEEGESSYRRIHQVS